MLAVSWQCIISWGAVAVVSGPAGKTS